jgi:hypothetical protein
MQLEAMIERLWRCTWRPRSREFRDALGGRDRARLVEYWDALNLEVVSSAGRRDGSGESIHWLTCNCGNVEN